MRILVMGCGSIGKRHAGNLKRLSVGEVLVYDPDADRARAVAESYDARGFSSLSEAYDASPDAVLVCTPTAFHLEHAREALQHGCSVFVEKPISHSMEGVDELLAEAKRRRRVLHIGYNLRFDPLMKMIREVVRSGQIGKVLSARLHFGYYMPARHPWEDYRRGYGARSDLGGGVLLDSSHEIDFALWTFGEPTSIFAAGGKFSELEIDVEDVMEIALCYRDKAISIHLNFIERPRQRVLHVVGSEGQLRSDLDRRELQVYEAATQEWRKQSVACPFDESYVNELRHFLDCIETGVDGLDEAYAAVRTLAAAEVIRVSMQTGEARRMDWTASPAGAISR